MYLDGFCRKGASGEEIRNVSVLVAIEVNREGHRELPGVVERAREDKESWTSFLRYLKEGGLKKNDDVDLFAFDKRLGLIESLGAFYPDAP